MERFLENRRDFLKTASAALLLPFVIGCKRDTATLRTESGILAAIKKNAIQDPSNEWWGARDAPADVRSKTILITDADPGRRIAINGTVYKNDGKIPAPNILLYFYHTDVHGNYGRPGEHRHGRYRGWVLTDQNGRYGFQTILPASYPDSTQSKHIHMTVTGVDFKEDWIDSILFEGDPFVTVRERVPQRGGFNHVLKMRKVENGFLHGMRDIRLA